MCLFFYEDNISIIMFIYTWVRKINGNMEISNKFIFIWCRTIFVNNYSLNSTR